MNPYAAARKQLFAAEPQIFRSDVGDHAEDMIFESLLLAPDKSHFEFVLLRAFSDAGEPGTLYIFSRRIGLVDQGEAERTYQEYSGEDFLGLRESTEVSIGSWIEQGWFRGWWESNAYMFPPGFKSFVEELLARMQVDAGPA